MPELPEVQTIVDQLNEVLKGQRITGAEVRLPKVFAGSRDQVLGSRIEGVTRRGKMIIAGLDNRYSLVIHLKLTGQLIYGKLKTQNSKLKTKTQNLKTFSEQISFPDPIPFAGKELPGKTTHIIFTFNDGSKLFFNDMRQFGWIKVVKNEELRGKIDEKLGPDALGEDFTPEYLAKICSNWGRPIKLLLMEQRKIAGIGNIYANEALWRAGISPMKRGRALESGKVKELWGCMRKVLEEGLKYGGSSAADEAYVDAHGRPGKMQEHFVVYQKDGTECPRCHHTIRRSQLGGRGTFFCPKCQK